MELRDYQKAAVNAVLNEWDIGRNKTLVVMPTGCHHPLQGLMMSDGSIKCAHAISIGESLMGMNGTARRILHKVSGVGLMYLVTPVKGNPFIVNGTHKLTLQRTNETNIKRFPCDQRGGEIVDVTVADWLGWSKWQKHLHKLFRVPVPAFPKGVSLPIHPYALGLMLGDGSFCKMLSFTTMDAILHDELNQLMTRHNLCLQATATSSGKATTYKLVPLIKGQHYSVAFRRMLRFLGRQQRLFTYPETTQNQ